MTIMELHAILPLLTLTGGIVCLMLQVAFFRSHGAALGTTLVVLLLAICASLLVAAGLGNGIPSVQATALLLVDRQALLLCTLLLLAGVAVAILGRSYLRSRAIIPSATDHPEAFYILLLLCLLGACTLACASHFASFFLALELVGLSLYPLLGFPLTGNGFAAQEREPAMESAIKYLLLSALTSALGLFGIALVYGATGALEFAAVAAAIEGPAAASGLMQAGVTLVLAAMAFKLSLVPFHIWTPDVYQGAPTPVTALIATVSKAAAVAILLRLLTLSGLGEETITTSLLTVLAVASILGGNLLALMQDDVKRLLAYSSIAHIGYLAVALLIDGAFGGEAALYYLIAYIVTTLGAFATVSLVADEAVTDVDRHNAAGMDPCAGTYFAGLFWRAPLLGGCFAAMLLSLAGIPLTIGFIGKFYIFAAGIEGELWLVISAVIVGSALGLFYYLRLLLALFRRDHQRAAANGTARQVSLDGQLLLLVLSVTLLALGVFPQPLINWLHALYT
ncbi:NADH-quinone oxidoreductase subunit N [Microbulbifer guangxiensis]|uniref:NADH-quinone oxidoreductase subunit N n=1 Tax=Microbulbifer guangxiensis TaxID=2904249 RepID=UPI001F163221|nr:NADH-quinone oxidoreductase subunit N [Microbulbifer guangxiensis]